MEDIFNKVRLIVGKVNHSYAMSLALLNPWVIIKNSGTCSCACVVIACTSIASLGEHASILVHCCTGYRIYCMETR